MKNKKWNLFDTSNFIISYIGENKRNKLHIQSAAQNSNKCSSKEKKAEKNAEFVILMFKKRFTGSNIEWNTSYRQILGKSSLEINMKLELLEEYITDMEQMINLRMPYKRILENKFKTFNGNSFIKVLFNY